MLADDVDCSEDDDSDDVVKCLPCQSIYELKNKKQNWIIIKQKQNLNVSE